MAEVATTMDVQIPDKMYFKIGEVARLVRVKPYVLRYWETEFPSLKPSKSKSNQRVYRRRDVETLLEIRRLLYEERYTIAGAKTLLRRKSHKGGKSQLALKFPEDHAAILRRVKRELEEIVRLTE